MGTSETEQAMGASGSLVAGRQRPLRVRYREDPDAAVTTKRVRTVDAAATDPMHGAVEVLGDYPPTRWVYGTDNKVGGDDDLPNSGHLLCAALAACEDNTLRMVADHVGVDIVELEVEVVGEVDCRACLDMTREVPVGFRSLDMRVHLRVAAGTDEALVDRMLELAERLCVNLDTVRTGVPVEVSYPTRQHVPTG